VDDGAQARLRVLAAARALVERVARLHADLERTTGAPIAMLRVLVCIEREPGVRVSRVATLLAMKGPALSHVLRGLVQRGWISRDRSPQDERVVELHLTSAGRRVLRATSGRAVGILQRAVERLPAAALPSLADGLESLILQLPPMPDTPSTAAVPRRTQTGRPRRLRRIAVDPTG